MKTVLRLSILTLMLLFAQSLFAQTPTLHIWGLVNSGKPNPAIDVTSESDIADLRSRLSDLPAAAKLSGSVLGWNGFLLENRGVPSFRAQVQVLFGVIKIVQGPGSPPQYFQDTKGFNDRIEELGSGIFPSSNGVAGENRGSASTAGDEIRDFCPEELPTNGSEPSYLPGEWNKPGVEGENNCYNYACNRKAMPPPDFAQPGRASHREPAHFTCGAYVHAATGDGLTARDCDKKCRRGTFKVALVLDPKGNPKAGQSPDFHWYQQNKDGTWSHKPGGTAATNKDSKGNAITDPRTADRRRRDKANNFVAEYTDFCSCFCVDPQTINIQ